MKLKSNLSRILWIAVLAPQPCLLVTLRAGLDGFQLLGDQRRPEIFWRRHGKTGVNGKRGKRRPKLEENGGGGRLEKWEVFFRGGGGLKWC